MLNKFRENQSGLEAAYQKHIAAPRAAKAALSTQQRTSGTSRPSDLDDDAVIEKAGKAKNGDAFQRLMGGDWAGYKSQSEADQALMFMLAWWTGNNSDQMQRLFCASGLNETISRKPNPEAYLNRTIQAAIAGTSDTYQPRQQRQKAARAERKPEQAQQDGDDRPLIIWNEAQLPEIVNKTEDAIISANKSGKFTLIFQRGGILVRIGKAASIAIRRGTIKSPGTNVIFPVTSNYLQNYLTEIIRWQKWNERKQEYVDCACPKKVADIILEKHGEYRVPNLHGIITAPTLRPDGSILDKPGYDEAAGIYFDPGGVHFLPVPQHPSKAEALQAMNKLLHVVSEFPFKTENDRAVAIAAIITPMIRRSLPTAPLTAYDAPEMGTGKTKLGNITSHIAYGHGADNTSFTSDEAEMGKRILSILMEGAGVVNLDNLEQPLTGETLCTVLTQETYKSRILGKNQNADVSTNVTWVATGNNVTVKGDMRRRVLLCQLDAQMERPEERTFKINLDEYIPAHRAELVVAGLTILRAHSLATDKPELKTYGQFEAWSDTVRSAVVWCGLPDPLNTREVIDANDPERNGLIAVLTAWHETFGDMTALAKDAIDPKIGSKELVEALKGAVYHRGELDARVVGNWIRTRKERRINGLRFVQAGKRQNSQLWMVQGTS